MPVRAVNLVKIGMVAAVLALGGCGRSNEAELAKIDNSIVGNDADPALTSALEDQIMVDPALTQQSNQLAVRRPRTPVQAQYPLPNGARGSGKGEATATAEADAATGCGAKVDYNMGWARRLPAAFGIFPGGRVTEAAGSNAGNCSIRAVSYLTDAPPQRILDWYGASAARAGYSAEHQLREGDHILAGTNGDAAYYLIVSPKGKGSDVALIANNGR